LQWKLGEALERYNTSLEICTKANNKWGMGRLYNNIANIYEMTMDFDKAIEFQKKRQDIAVQLKDRDGNIKSCACLAALYHVKNDDHTAIRYKRDVLFC